MAGKILWRAGWLGLHLAAYPLALILRVWLARRAAQGKEELARISERYGRPSRARPQGILIWIHAASVGEARAALPLVGKLLEQNNVSVLVTTGTVTSAAVMARDLPARAIHHYAPLDLPFVTARFLNHWRPDGGLWLESEFWPGHLAALRHRRIPLALVNGRMSQRSFARWRRVQPLAAAILGAFKPLLAQDEIDAERFRSLGGYHAVVGGNLKAAALPLPAPMDEWERLAVLWSGRWIWLAASTHPGEEEAALAAQRRMKAQGIESLLILAPRHPERGEELAALLQAQGLRFARRSRNEPPRADLDVYLADSIGEMGLWYRLAAVTFIGGSLVPHGGQNPLEAARLGSACILGPHMENFAAVIQPLEGVGGVRRIGSADELAQAVSELLQDSIRRRSMASAAAMALAQQSQSLDAVWTALDPWRREAGLA